MATCNDIEQSLAALKANNDAKFAAMQAQITECCNKTDDALAKSLEALQAIAGIVSDVQQALSAIATISQTLQALQGIVSGGAATLAALAATVANLLITIGSIGVLGGRIDALESGLTNLGNEVGANYQDLFNRIQNISLIPGAKGDKGDKGDRGDRGFPGLDGQKGDPGIKGDKGDTGERGERGFPGLDGRTPVLGVDYFNGVNGRDGYTPQKGIDYFDGANGTNGIDGKNGKDGEDKGLNCQEMIACLNQYNSTNNPNAGNFTEINNRLDNIANITNNTGNNVQNMAIQIPAIAASIATILGLLSTVLGLINSIRDFLFPKPDPLSEGDMTRILDNYFPFFAGTVNGKDCTGTTITKQYQGKGLQGIERMFGATNDLTNELLSSLCQDANQQGFINATVCGKPFTGTFRGANEGIQRLGDLIGFAANQGCENTEDVIDRFDWGTKWNIEIKPQFELSLNFALEQKFNENFPTISDRFSVSLCDGTTTSYGYLGKGFGGVQLALQAMHTMQTRQLDSYFACIVTNFFPEFSGILKTTFCDGTDYSESYLERGIIGLNNVLKLQNKMNVIWQNRFAECFLENNVEKKYSGSFNALDCQGRNISGGYFNLPIDGVLGVMFQVLDKKIDDLCGDYQDSILVQDCEGDILRGEYQGKGYRGLQIGMKIYTQLIVEVIKSLCNKLDADGNAPTSGLVRLEACDQVFQGTYNAPKKSETNAIAQLGFKLVGDAINAICVKTEEDKNVRTSGTLSLDFCGQSEQVNYLVAKESEVSGFANFMMQLLGKAFDRLCDRLDDLEDLIDPNSPNQPRKTGNLNISACGTGANVTWDVFASQEPQVIAQAQVTLLQRILDTICTKLQPETPQPRLVPYDICGTTGNISLLSTASDFNLFTSFKDLTDTSTTILCNKFNELDDCDPVIIEPSDKYIDRVITSQATIWFYPVGTTKSQRKTSPKWRLQLSNPRPGLTCTDFAPLTWQRGYWLSKVRFDMGGIETYSYFADYDPVTQTGDAVDKMLYFASLSTIPLKSPKPRPTRTEFPGVLTPNQPTIEVHKVIFAYYDSNGQKVGVECLNCKP